MKKLKVIYNIALVILCLTIVGINYKVSYADLIWTPNNSFFEEQYNLGNLEYTNRNYLINSSAGFVIMRETPEDTGKELSRIQNGITIYVGYTYGDANGVRWGAANYYIESQTNNPTIIGETSSSASSSVTGSDIHEGWIKLSECRIVYDENVFMQEYAGTVKKFNADVSTYCPEFSTYLAQNGNNGIIIWNYPGSPNTKTVLDGTYAYNLNYVYSVYEDELGRQWGYYGKTLGWICLSDPTNPQIYASMQDPALSYQGAVTNATTLAAETTVAPTAAIAETTTVPPTATSQEETTTQQPTQSTATTVATTSPQQITTAVVSSEVATTTAVPTTAEESTQISTNNTVSMSDANQVSNATSDTTTDQLSTIQIIIIVLVILLAMAVAFLIKYFWSKSIKNK